MNKDIINDNEFQININARFIEIKNVQSLFPKIKDLLRTKAEKNRIMKCILLYQLHEIIDGWFKEFNDKVTKEIVKGKKVSPEFDSYITDPKWIPLINKTFIELFSLIRENQPDPDIHGKYEKLEKIYQRAEILMRESIGELQFELGNLPAKPFTKLFLQVKFFIYLTTKFKHNWIDNATANGNTWQIELEEVRNVKRILNTVHGIILGNINTLQQKNRCDLIERTRLIERVKKEN